MGDMADWVNQDDTADDMSRAESEPPKRKRKAVALVKPPTTKPLPRCQELWANWNQCVRPAGHPEPHLTTTGAGWGRSRKADTNASIIAAAPELLAACKLLVGCLNSDLDDEQCDAWDAAVVAIAKAESKEGK